MVEGVRNREGGHARKIFRFGLCCHPAAKEVPMAGHGGKREGAGRPPGPNRTFSSAAEFLLWTINNIHASPLLRLKAAIALLQHGRPGGVKSQRQEAAQAAACGAFEPPAAPRLRVVDEDGGGE